MKKPEMIIFDWAGTTVDYGSLAPLVVFDSVFRQRGIVLSRDTIASYMGLEKKTHIQSLLNIPEVKRQWEKRYGTGWSDEDIEGIYDDFKKNISDAAEKRSIPLPGVTGTVHLLKKMGMVIASTTGYSSSMMESVEKTAHENGYAPDIIVTPDMVGGKGRPEPFMIYECMRIADIFPADRVIKVGDTLADIQEGSNAGVWTVGTVRGSSLMGLDLDEEKALPRDELEKRMNDVRIKYFRYGADFVIDDISELPYLVEQMLCSG